VATGHNTRMPPDVVSPVPYERPRRWYFECFGDRMTSILTEEQFIRSIADLSRGEGALVSVVCAEHVAPTVRGLGTEQELPLVKEVSECKGMEGFAQ
jgi:hypothetical protein